MSLKKTYFKTKDTCKVNFRLPKEAVNDANDVNIVGEFNDWDINATPLKKLKNGAFSGNLELQKGKEYQFRYLIDKQRWEDEQGADKFVPTPFEDAKNSVIVL